MNLSVNSGVSHYETGIDFIKVQFTDGAQYLYNNRVTGKDNIEYMKILAAEGRGLCGFISTNVKKLYAQKLRGKSSSYF